MKHWLVFLGVVALAITAGPTLAAQRIESVYAFGDNYTAIVGGPYFQGRWCNGPVWSEQLASRLGLPNQARNNRALGAATAQAVLAQTQAVAAGNLDASLSLVFAGAIDFGSAFNPDPTQTSWNLLAAQVLAHSSNAVRTLYLKGARTVVVVNQPDYMRFPQFANLSAGARSFYRRNLVQFNESLRSTSVALSTMLPGLRVAVADLFLLCDTVLDRPETYGFTEAEASVQHDARLANKSFDGPGRNYLFWDPVSISSKMHTMFAQWVEAVVLGTSLGLNPLGEQWVLSAERLLLGKTYVLQSSEDASVWTDLQSEQVLFFAGDLHFQPSFERDMRLFRLRYVDSHEP